MAKRYTDTNKWNDDWYISLGNDYRIIWQWLLDNCDHAGVCKPSIGMINMLCKTNISEDELLNKMDGRVLKFDGFWFIPKFLKFQYKTLNVNKPAIVSVVKILNDKDLLNIVNELFGNDFIMIIESLDNHSIMIKDKDKDKDNTLLNSSRKGGMGENQNWSSMPTHDQVGELPDLKINSAIEFVRISKGPMLSQDEIKSLWKIFKIQNLTGEKYYRSESDVYSHFVNWLKIQKINDKSKSKSDGAAQLLAKAKRDFANLKNEKEGSNAPLQTGITAFKRLE